MQSYLDPMPCSEVECGVGGGAVEVGLLERYNATTNPLSASIGQTMSAHRKKIVYD